MTLMAIGRVFYSDFGLFYQVPMNAGTLFSTTQTIDTYVYRGLMEQGNVGMSSAAGVYQSLVGFVTGHDCKLYCTEKRSGKRIVLGGRI